MTRHTRNRQMVEEQRLHPRKCLNLRDTMSESNVSMKSIYSEPRVWDLDPNFHTIRINTLARTYNPHNRTRTNKRLTDKYNKLKQQHPNKLYPELYEQVDNETKYPLHIIKYDDGTWHTHSLTFKLITKTLYLYTKKQPHISGEGRYFNRILGQDKHGCRHYGDGRDLEEEYKGLFDKEGYRLVIDHGNGTHSKTY
ncbi:hypothetical protein DIGNKC_6 [Bacillus phage DIGNKC]|uniref:hypothetical protein n=1 Tax=Bacillus phage DIGNKC TaxID=1805948 RepID=UPI0007A76F2E|nr:hypothetical protein BI007_gp006 [Bacillus phage DIGNKC]AMW62898.1 hypothetical protein DIGNKC_6 [Bacillus phage DIGNKC]